MNHQDHADCHWSCGHARQSDWNPFGQISVVALVILVDGDAEGYRSERAYWVVRKRARDLYLFHISDTKK